MSNYFYNPLGIFKFRKGFMIICKVMKNPEIKGNHKNVAACLSEYWY